MYGVTKCVLRLTALALMVMWPSAPSAAQATAETMYEFAEIETPYGPLGIGYREKFIPTGGYTHEILAAHPIWGGGYDHVYYSMDCATGSYAKSNNAFYFWHGKTSGSRGNQNRTASENGIDRPLTQIFGGTAGRKELIQAVICGTGPLDISPTRVSLDELRERFRAIAGPLTAPWRMLTFQEGGDRSERAQMQFSLWDPEENDDGKPRENGFVVETGDPPVGGFSAASWPMPWGRGENFLIGIRRIEGQHGSNPETMIDFIVREGVGNNLIRRLDIQRGLTQIFATTADGTETVLHLRACPNRPGILYVASASYKSMLEQMFAMRLVNSMSVDCR